MTDTYLAPQEGKVNQQVCPSDDVFADSTVAAANAETVEIAFTICAGERPVSKTYAVGSDGTPQAIRGAGMSEGKARV